MNECDCQNDDDPFQELLRKRQYQEALALAQAEISEDPNSFNGHHMCGIAFSGLKKFDAAISYYEAAIRLTLESDLRALCYYDIGLLQYDRQFYKEAFDSFSAILQEKDNLEFLHIAYLYRADCNFQMGRYSEALEDCKKVPDGFDFPGFRMLMNGGKKHIMADLQKIFPEATGN